MKIEQIDTLKLRRDKFRYERWINDQTILEATEAKSWQKSIDEISEELDRRELQGAETR